VSGVLFECGDDQIEGGKSLFGFGSIQPVQVSEFTVEGVIFAFPNLINQEILAAKQACSHLPKKKRHLLLREMLRGRIGMALAHELTHAFGLNLTIARFQHMPTPELELATDSVAFLSCDELLGDSAHLGASYINKRIKENPSQDVSRNTVRDVALRTVKSLQFPAHEDSYGIPKDD